jgi:hypothetical protein
MNLMMVPMWVLSGVFFSSSNFPEVVQPFIRVLPLTALVDALRGVVLEGATLRGIRFEMATLAAWAIVPFSIGLRIFQNGASSFETPVSNDEPAKTWRPSASVTVRAFAIYGCVFEWKPLTVT